MNECSTVMTTPLKGISTHCLLFSFCLFVYLALETGYQDSLKSNIGYLAVEQQEHSLIKTTSSENEHVTLKQSSGNPISR